MERAIYCYAWLPGRPNCHPVHTMKHIGMVEDLARNKATMLSWSMMGSGSISLPFLERQIYGEMPPQLRFHGYLSDKEFNEECLKRGILPYAVVYQAQGWEFPVVLNDDQTEILEMNIIRSDKKTDWYGLREFSQGKLESLFDRSFSDYFPEGMINSDGEQITDLWQECTARDVHGRPTHSHWVEVEGLSQTCHGTCRNNPVWRQYLKKMVEIQIDAGAMAIQLDESETPICSIGYGGCFCKDCLKQFREFLQALKQNGELPSALADIDLSRFDYAAYLRERNINWPDNFYNIPLSEYYWRFLVESHNKHFQEIIRHIKEYGRKADKEIMVSGNFTNMHLLYLPSLDSVDCCITELRRTVFKRHNWFRLAAGYTQDKPLVLAESPYDGFMPKFVDLVHRGKADDYYKLFIMEAAVHGCNMAFPYGAWMGNQTRDSFHAPYRIGEKVQKYLCENDAVFSKKSGANVLVLYSYGSYMERDWQCGQGENISYTNSDDLLSYSVVYDERAARVPFFEVTQDFVDGQIPFDVLVLGDGKAAEDKFSMADLADYDFVVVPDCFDMTPEQVRILAEYAAVKPVFVYGKVGENCVSESSKLKQADNFFAVEDISDPKESLGSFMSLFSNYYQKHQLYSHDNAQVYVQRNLLETGVAYHMLNYAYDARQHQTIPQDIVIDLKGFKSSRIEVKTFEDQPVRYELQNAADGTRSRVKLYQIPAYCSLVIS